MSATTEAVWTGPYEAETPGGTLQPGDTALVTDADLLSGHWQAVPKTRGNKTAAAVTDTPAPAADIPADGGDS